MGAIVEVDLAFGQALERVAERLGPSLAAHWREADPRGTVSPRSRRLCVGLGLLAAQAHEALGGTQAIAAARVAARLAAVTKIDDQIIDGRAFHGGHIAERRGVHARTVAFLAPTLTAIRTGQAPDDSARARHAAVLGREASALARDRNRLDAWLDIVSWGWEVQADAVSTLSRHPRDVTLAEVEAVAADISGAWLLMIAAAGALGTDRWLTPQEIAAFRRVGAPIQTADFLADLGRDHEDGLWSTTPVCRAFAREPARVSAALQGDVPQLYALVAETGANDPGDVEPPLVDLAALGAVPTLLRWIHSYLCWRYATHPHTVLDRPAPAADDRTSWK